MEEFYSLNLTCLSGIEKLIFLISNFSPPHLLLEHVKFLKLILFCSTKATHRITATSLHSDQNQNLLLHRRVSRGQRSELCSCIDCFSSGAEQDSIVSWKWILKRPLTCQGFKIISCWPPPPSISSTPSSLFYPQISRLSTPRLPEGGLSPDGEVSTLD